MIGLLFAFSSQPSEKGKHEQAPTILAETPTDALFYQAEQLKDSLKYQSAALVYQKAADDYLRQQNWPQYFNCQHHIAHCLWVTHRGYEATDLCETMIESACQELGEAHIVLAGFYTVLGNVYADRRTQKDFERCVDYYEKALAITKALYGDHHPALADAYDRLGIARFVIDDYDRAIPYYEKALTFLDTPNPGNATSYAQIYNHLGLIYQAEGYFPKALENFEKAADMIRNVQGKTNSRVVKNLINIGEVKIQMGDLAEALITLEEAWALETKVGESKSKLKSYIMWAMGDAYMVSKDYQRAIDYFQQCLPFWDPANRDDVNGLIVELSKIGECYLHLNQADQAQINFQRVIGILEKHYDPDNLNWAQPLINLGLSYQQNQNFLQAEAYFLRALDIVHQKVGKRHPTAGKIQKLLAELCLETEKQDEAFRWVQNAEKAFLLKVDTTQTTIPLQMISDLPSYIATLELTGAIKLQQYNTTADISDLYRANEALRKGLMYSDSLKVMLHTNSDLQHAQRQVYSLSEKALNGLFLLWQQTCEDQYLQEAFVFFEKSKSAWLRTSARDQYAKLFAGIPQAVIERELTLKTQLAFYQNLKKNYHPALAESDSFKVAIWQDRIIQTKYQLDSLLEHLEKRYPSYYKLKYDFGVASLAGLRKFARQEKVDVVTYFWGDRSLQIMAITPDEVQWENVADNDGVYRQLASFKEITLSGGLAWQTDNNRIADFHAFCDLAHSLYTTLLPSKLDQSRLIIIPDGPLGYLPFQILLTDRPKLPATMMDYRGLPYLLLKKPVQFEYSASFLEAPNINRKGNGYIGFSPTYDGGTQIADLGRDEHHHEMSLFPPRQDEWNKLLHNEEEINETIRLIGGKHYTGTEATERTFKRVASQAKILHLAMHTKFCNIEPDHSALVFARDEVYPEDGRLYAYELYNLPLQSDLAVLSACNTGNGILQRGEGIMSLSRAFQYAGCPSVVMSLWQADDVSTKDIMVGFFDYLKQGNTKSEALQLATKNFLETTKNDHQTHPFYWGNFVLTGKNDAIDLPRHHTTYFWWFFLAGAILAGIGYRKFSRTLAASLR
ncbi:MAG: hypothetical protein DHS20C18_48720 [Saprospiraceae bacterium]|nr:MAG: hypothetical protein DHS20C18_48720 [Saprospiraceae bacterium]